MVYRLIVVLVFGSMVGTYVQAADSSENEDRLFAAIKDGDLNALKKLYAAGIDINKPNERENWDTPLVTAVVYQGNLKVVASLLEARADKDAKHKTTGSTPLMHAIKNLNSADEVARLLIDTKANVNGENLEKKTALLLAIEKGKGRLTEMLIKAGAAVDVVSALRISPKRGPGETPLTAAIKQCNFPVAMLLEHGAPVNMPNSDGDTPLICGIKYGGPDIVPLLLSCGADVSLCNLLGLTPLMVVKKGYEKDAEALLDAGANPHQCNKYGKTAFDYARENWFDLEGLLLRRAEKPKPRAKFLAQNDSESKEIAVDTEQRQLVQAIAAVPVLSSKRGDQATFKSSLEYAIDINRAREKAGDTLLTAAARDGNTLKVDTLLARKVNIDEQHKDTGNTALVIAILEHSSPLIAELLINAKADPNVRNKNEETALLCAVQKKRSRVINLLIKAGAAVDVASRKFGRADGGSTILTCAIKMDDIGLLKMFLNLNPAPPIDLEGACDGTPLIYAITFEDLNVVKLLLHYRADFNKPDRSGFTPLTAAVSVGNSEIVRALLYAGADVSKQDNNGKTAFDLVEGKDSILSLLQQAQDKSLFLKPQQEQQSSVGVADSAISSIRDVSGPAGLLVSGVVDPAPATVKRSSTNEGNGAECAVLADDNAFKGAFQGRNGDQALPAGGLAVPPVAAGPLAIPHSSFGSFLPSFGVIASFGVATLLAAALCVWHYYPSNMVKK